MDNFWVIETARTTYWDGKDIREKAYFTGNIHEAIKFYDFQSAENVRLWLLDMDGQRLKAVEHAYMSPQEKSKDNE